MSPPLDVGGGRVRAAPVLALLLAGSAVVALAPLGTGQDGAILEPGGTVYWDSDASGNVSADDVVLSGDGAGSFVGEADPSIGAPLAVTPLRIGLLDWDKDPAYSAGDRVYLDSDGNGSVSTRDVRWSGSDPFGSLVNETAELLGFDYESLDLEPSWQVRYTDVDANAALSPGDGLYLMGNTSTLEENAVRLTAVGGFAPGTKVQPGDTDTIYTAQTVPGALSVAQAPTPLEVMGIEPAGAVCGETIWATVLGSGFSEEHEVDLGAGVLVNDTRFVSAERIDVLLKVLAGAGEGTRNVSVGTPGESATLPDGFGITCPVEVTRPDLTVTLGGPVLSDDHRTLLVDLAVSNNGNATSPSTELTLDWGDPSSTQGLFVPPVEPGGTWTTTSKLAVLQGQTGSLPVSATVDPANLVDEWDEGNNVDALVVDIGMPDLRVEWDGWFLSDDRSTLEVTLIVSNVGDAVSPTAEISVDWGDLALTQTLRVSSLEPGETRRMSTRTSLADHYSGPALVTATVDPGNAVREMDDVNNDAVLQTTIPPLPSESDWDLVLGFSVLAAGAVGGGGFMLRARLKRNVRPAWERRAHDEDPPHQCIPGNGYCKRDWTIDLAARSIASLEIAWTEQSGKGVVAGGSAGEQLAESLNKLLHDHRTGRGLDDMDWVLGDLARDLWGAAVELCRGAEGPLDLTIEAAIEGSECTVTFTRYKCKSTGTGTTWKQVDQWDVKVQDAWSEPLPTVQGIQPDSQEPTPESVTEIARGLGGLVARAAQPVGPPRTVVIERA